MSNKSVQVGICTEDNESLGVKIVQPFRFSFPQQFGFNAFSILRPHWKIYFSDPATGNEKTAYADSSLSLSHSRPVTLDRFAALPVIYLNKRDDYAISVRDEFGIERYKIDFFRYPDTVSKLVSVGVAQESNQAIALIRPTIEVGLAQESSQALTVTPVKSVAVGVATENNTAPAVTVGGFDPSMLFNDGQAGFWFDFTDPSTLWQDTAATTPVTATGQSIARIDDKANSNNATQSTAGNRPTYTEAGALSYTAFAADYLTIESSTASFAWMHQDIGLGIAALVQFGVVADPNTVYAILGNSDGASAQRGIALYFDDRAAVSRQDNMIFQTMNGVTSQWPYQIIAADNTAPANTELSVVANVPSGGPANLLVNDSSVGMDARSSVPSGANASQNLHIGAPGAGIFPFTGRIYHLIVRDEEFSAQELADIQNFFNSIPS